MRRRIMWILAGVLVVGFAGGLTASAHLDDEMQPGQLEDPERLTLPLGERTFVDVDLGKRGESRGDRLYVRAEIPDEDGGSAGHALAICEQFSPKFVVIYCDNEVHIFGRGTILASGFQNIAGPPIVVDPILGGTGEFKNARGQVTLNFAEGTVTIELLP